MPGAVRVSYCLRSKVSIQALCGALHNACVVTLVDRLLHKVEIIAIEGKSYRHREAEERAGQREKSRNAKRTGKQTASKKEGHKDD